MAILDFLFGSDALKKAAGKNDKPSTSNGDAGIDVGRLAQESADRAKAQSAPKQNPKSTSPLSSTMTPMPAKKAKQ